MPTSDNLRVAPGYAVQWLIDQNTGVPVGVRDRWVAANVTTLAQAQDAITTLAIAVSVLGRRL